MGKRVIIVASGETERRSLPHLVEHLQAEGIAVTEIRIPPRNRTLNVEMLEKLVKAAWYENIMDPPDKFVVLVDLDGKAPARVLNPIQERLPGRLGEKIQATIQFAYAQWHLEAWYFADASGLRTYFGGRSLGHVDASEPDNISDPKRHLNDLLGEQAYTAMISEEMARGLNPHTIEQRSPSFRGFLEAVRNGKPGPPLP